MILVDTLIWINHFRYDDSELRKIINDDQLLCHPFVVGELALGSLRERAAVLEFSSSTRGANRDPCTEVMTIIDRHSIFSMGLVTQMRIYLLQRCSTGDRLWTRDAPSFSAAAQKAGAALYTHAQASR